MIDFDALPFIPGLELSEQLYEDGVRPILRTHFPHISYAAARLDYGSDVLGFDTPQSRDHGWGPKVTLFLSREDCERHHAQIMAILADELPLEICGYPTNYDEPFTGEAGLVPIKEAPVNHWVEVTTSEDFFINYLGVNPTTGLETVDWLIIPQQHLRTIASGRIFHDGSGILTKIRKTLRWYPDDIWYYILANQWRRIDQEEPFMARCGDVRDELGSVLIASRMVQEIMRLCFLMERRYQPYSKWFGTAFQQLSCAPKLNPIFQDILRSRTWREREAHLTRAYQVVMELHNALLITSPIDVQISAFHSRPYQVPHVARFVDALHGQIQSEAVRVLPRDFGALDQYISSTDILSNLKACHKFRKIYR